MCLQCVVEAKTITIILRADLDEGAKKRSLFLMKATKSAAGEWEAGQWGLVMCNDPEMVWTGEAPWPDPSFGVPDEVQKAWTAEQNALASKWLEDARKFVTAFEEQVSVYAAYQIGDMCKLAGWDGEGLFTYWLFHKMGERCLNPVFPD